MSQLAKALVVLCFCLCLMVFATHYQPSKEQGPSPSSFKVNSDFPTGKPAVSEPPKTVPTEPFKPTEPPTSHAPSKESVCSANDIVRLQQHPDPEVRAHDIIGLTSFPRSGNSFLRKLLEISTGIATGSIFNDKKLHSSFSAEHLKNKGEAIFIKTHYPRFSLYFPVPPKKTLMLIRDPFAVFDSFYNFEQTRSHSNSLSLDERAKKAQRWSKFIKNEARLWASFYDRWEVSISKGQDVLMIHYEQLAKNCEGEMTKILQWAFEGEGYLDSFLQKVKCTCGLVVNTDAAYHKREKFDFSEIFTEEDQREVLALVRKHFCSHGFDKLHGNHPILAQACS